MKDHKRIRKRGPIALKIAIAFLASLFAASFSATEVFAILTHFAPVLGSHYWYLYPPWNIIIWWQLWHGSHAFLFTAPAWFGAGLGAFCFLIYSVKAIHRWQQLKQYDDVHGSARWAKLRDLHATGLVKSVGVYVGEWKNGQKIYTLRHNGPEHVLCYAPPRSGKGVGLVVPTMLTWPHSAVVTDLKREIYELTAGGRGTHGNTRILRFEPASSTHSVAFNPLDEIRMGTDHETGDMQNLATLIVDPDGRGLKTHWQKKACALMKRC